MDLDRVEDLTLRLNGRARSAYCLGWGLTVAIVGVLIIVLLNSVWESPTFLAFGIGLIVVAVGVIVWRADRACVRFSDAGIGVKGPLQGLVLGWQEIREITFEQRSLLSAVFIPAPAFTWIAIRGQRELVLYTRAGRRIAARSSGATTPLERDEVRAIASRHNIAVGDLKPTAQLGRH